MRHKIVICCALSLFILHACSIALPLIIENRNKTQPPYSTINNAQALKKLRKTSRIRLTRTDGEIIEGKFLGFFQYTDKQYADLYRNFCNTPVKTIVPALGDSIWLIQKKRRGVQGIFQGFDLYQVCYRDKKGRRKTMDIDKIARLHWKHEVLATSGLRSLFLLREPRLPLRSYVALDCDKSQVIVSLNELETFVKVKQEAVLSGYVILGMFADVLIFTMYLAYTLRGLGELE